MAGVPIAFIGSVVRAGEPQMVIPERFNNASGVYVKVLVQMLQGNVIQNQYEMSFVSESRDEISIRVLKSLELIGLSNVTERALARHVVESADQRFNLLPPPRLFPIFLHVLHAVVRVVVPEVDDQLLIPAAPGKIPPRTLTEDEFATLPRVLMRGEVEDCPICLGPMNHVVVCLPCNHMVHGQCLLPWLVGKTNTYPKCHAPVEVKELQIWIEEHN